MTYMNEDFIEDNDLDWFAAFPDGRIAHFTSGGTAAVPDQIKESIEDYETIYDYFYSLRNRCGADIVETNLPFFTSRSGRVRYLQSFIEISNKGLYSYNINLSSNHYLLIAKPLVPLLWDDLSEEIKSIIYKLPANLNPKLEIIV